MPGDGLSVDFPKPGGVSVVEVQTDADTVVPPIIPPITETDSLKTVELRRAGVEKLHKLGFASEEITVLFGVEMPDGELDKELR